MPDYPEVRGTFRTPGGRQVEMAFRANTNDYNTLFASLNEDEYRLPSGMSGRAVDVGGYLGSVGIAIALDNPGLQVTIIEPVPGNAALIRKNLELNDVGNASLIEGAVSGDHEPVTVWYGYTGNPTAEHHAFVGNSTLAYDNAGPLAHEEVTYTPLTLADLTESGPIDLLKIDCEGGEWAFLDSPATKDVALIIGESHAVRGHKGREIADLLPGHDVTIHSLAEDPDGNGTVEFRAVRR